MVDLLLLLPQGGDDDDDDDDNYDAKDDDDDDDAKDDDGDDALDNNIHRAKQVESMFDLSESWSNLWTQTRVVPDKIPEVTRITIIFYLDGKGGKLVRAIENAAFRFHLGSCLWTTRMG